MRRAERGELVACPLELRCRFGPAPDEPHDLGAMHPADAGEPSDRLPLAPACGGVGPLGGTPVVGQVAARADDVAEDHTRRVGAELTAERRRAHVLERRPAVLDTVRRRSGSSPDTSRRTPSDPRHRTEARCRPHGPRATRAWSSSPRRQASCTVRDREVPLSRGFGFAFEELFRSLQPTARERPLALGDELPSERERGERGLFGRLRVGCRGHRPVRARRSTRSGDRSTRLPSRAARDPRVRDRRRRRPTRARRTRSARRDEPRRHARSPGRDRWCRVRSSEGILPSRDRSGKG